MILIGNSFPMGLIKREVSITPITSEDVKTLLISNAHDSYYGHEDTRKAAEKLIGGKSLNTSGKRPAITLNEHNMPVLNGESYHHVIVITPTYVEGFRPTYGVEVPAEKLGEFNIILMDFS